ncbi:pentatricopeptide repeat-containing protein At5g66520-like [Benincasa hispida]|uniref:pentatricopeptide repeat-containing protein At5g66520-like n=1 Tax=Benincasa hispida TaxID=102211 RepID=UPI0019012B58|nr:pentatricopeptide repeat-containing protein At5g66520-like [Benincasa hispida]
MEVNKTAISAIGRSSRVGQQFIFSVLKCCISVRNLAKIHAQILVSGFAQKNYILVNLLSLYISFGSLGTAQKVFEDTSAPSTTVWNQIIRGHARSKTPQESIQLFKRMTAAEVEADGFTYSFLLSACVRSRLFREGEQIHGRVLVNGYWSNTYVRTNLINLYANGGGVGDFDLKRARYMFDEMPDANVVGWNSLLAGYVRRGDFDGARKVFDEMPERNVQTWTTMVAGFAQNGQCKLALSLFNQMRRAGMELDQVALVAALSACAELGNLTLGKWIHRYVERTWRSRHLPVLVSLNNSLMHMYASCGVMDLAYKVFKEMSRRNTVSWSSIITGFAKQGCGEEAIRVFQLMLCSGQNEVRPDEITFVGVLTACSHAGLIDDGIRLFQSMHKIFEVIPQIEHYGCMVDLLSRAGLLNEALKLIESMPMKPNNVVWGALLNGCRIHKNDKIASHVAKQLALEIDPCNQAAGYFMLLANVYAADKRWRDTAIVRQNMLDIGVKKPSGRSWIEINGVVCDFVAGDETHKDVSLIYEMLGNITRQARMESCKSETISEAIVGD